jgi:hypothetical protein
MYFPGYLLSRNAMLHVFLERNVQPLLPARIAVPIDLCQNYNYDEKGYVIFFISS